MDEPQTAIEEIAARSLGLDRFADPDPHVTFRWGPSTNRNLTVHSRVLDCYADGRWVCTVDIENVSRHSNWDIGGDVVWKYDTGHTIAESYFRMFNTSINNGTRRTYTEIGRSDWIESNFDIFFRPDISAWSGWAAHRNN